MVASVFLSYRRADSEVIVGRLRDHLVARFGENSVFKDVDSIPAGADFRKTISSAIGSCDVLLAIIGHDWSTNADALGSRRLENPEDYVRIEIETALEREIPVIPVLVRDAVMPSERDLPESLRDIAFRNAVKLRADPDFKGDAERLATSIRKYVRPSRRRLLAFLVSGIVLLATVATMLGNASKIRGFFRGDSAVATGTGDTSLHRSTVETTHIYLEDTAGEPILGNFEVIVRAPNGQQIKQGENGTLAVELPPGRSGVYVHVTMDDYAMLERPPLPINDSTVTIVMVDRVTPTAAPGDLALSPPAQEPPAATTSSNRLLRVRFRNEFNSAIQIFLYSPVTKVYQKILVGPKSIQVFERTSSHDSRYYITVRNKDKVDVHIGWVDFGKFDDDVVLNLTELF